MARHKDINWKLSDFGLGGCIQTEQCTLAVLMDIRDELKRINTRLDCHETLSIPALLRRIKANTTRKRKAKKKENR